MSKSSNTNTSSNMNSTSNEEGKQADNSYPLFLGASETQGTELSTLTVDTAITSPPKYTNTKRPATEVVM